MSSRVSTFWFRTFCVSTIGLAPLTVMASESSTDLHARRPRRREARGQCDALAFTVENPEG